MYKWSKSIPFNQSSPRMEKWTSSDFGSLKEFQVYVTLGKTIDILSLKVNEVEGFRKKVDEIRTSREKLFKKKLVKIRQCPICKSDNSNAKAIFEPYGGSYVQCPFCSHCYNSKILNEKDLNEFYRKEESYQKIYTDKKTVDIRLQQVALPKAKWVTEQYKRIYGKEPKSILDVGAGSGHFVKVCRDLGLKAEGLEISESGRQFCKNQFGFALQKNDFVKDYKLFKNFDVITFWAVLEHVPDPMKMLSCASKLISSKNALVVADVPKWNSFSTAVQKNFSDSITRHLEPLAHIHCFTDSSLATAFALNNFDVASAWYFGMDIYEMLTQFSYLLDKNIIRKLKGCIPDFQEKIDSSYLSDEMVFVGKSNIK